MKRADENKLSKKGKYLSLEIKAFVIFIIVVILAVMAFAIIITRDKYPFLVLQSHNSAIAQEAMTIEKALSALGR